MAERTFYSKSIESHFSNESKYRVSPDLLAATDCTIPAWSPSGPGQQFLVMSSDKPVIDYQQLHVRSRMAQNGIIVALEHPISPHTFLSRITNYSPVQRTIARGHGVLSLYTPSAPVRGKDLIRAVYDHIECNERDMVFLDMEGAIVGNAQHWDRETITYLGIRTNTDILFEVCPDADGEILPNGNVRAAATRQLQPVAKQTNSPFGVTTTKPIAVNGTHLTLMTDLYGALDHLPSVVIEPNRSQWKSNGGTTDLNTGIRLEFINKYGACITREMLPEYAVFTVHPTH